MLGVSFRRQIYYMAKAELFKNPFGAMIIRWLGAFPVQRGAGDGKAINEAEEVVKKGTQNLLKLMSIESVMPSNHLILCCALLLPPSIFPSIRVFSSESFLHIR